MQKLILVILSLLLIGCKKENPVAEPKPKEIDLRRDSTSIAFDSTVVTKKDDATLTAFYRSYGFATVWIAPAERKKLLELLQSSEKEGLFPNDYNVKKIEKLEAKVNKLSDAEMVSYDFLLTASIQKYIWHLSNGKLDPKKIYRDWDLKKNPIDINALLHNGIEGDSLAQSLESIKPQHVIYQSLKQALVELDNYPKDTVKTMTFTEKIVRGDTSSIIPSIKRRLIIWKELAPMDTITKIYDKKTWKAIKNFQRRHGLATDGVIGKGTVEALNFSPIRRKQQVMANLERWRWFPRDFGDHYIIVNIPGYYLRIIKDGDTIERKRIVVGKAERKTPILSSTFNNIVFNPTWTVPPTIIREDLVPDATNNRSYFANRSITIYNSKGAVVDPQKWNPKNPRAYRYVQAPGYYNSLGVVKFNFPNHYTVYLHDTNHRDYFGKNYRSLSSGCVRVEDPLPMAEYMLNDSIKWNRAKIDTLVATKKTTTINLKQKIRLHQLYWTAWRERNGDLEFRPDIYNLDEDLYQKLRK
ncbi:L,D-transpeptidase family protein [Flavobacterium sp.]|uniref:L,D-transpeptidase family protein n=1 Tax=Flavobacterium sp. TaxID=239 RepID=UPI0039E40F61